jgi:hypothetical protein
VGGAGWRTAAVGSGGGPRPALRGFCRISSRLISHLVPIHGGQPLRASSRSLGCPAARLLLERRTGAMSRAIGPLLSGLSAGAGRCGAERPRRPPPPLRAPRPPRPPRAPRAAHWHAVTAQRPWPPGRARCAAAGAASAGPGAGGATAAAAAVAGVHQPAPGQPGAPGAPPAPGPPGREEMCVTVDEANNVVGAATRRWAAPVRPRPAAGNRAPEARSAAAAAAARPHRRHAAPPPPLGPASAPAEVRFAPAATPPAPAP